MWYNFELVTTCLLAMFAIFILIYTLYNLDVIICSVFWLLPIHVLVLSIPLSKAKSFHCYVIFLILF
jgi:hypothetical protein